MATSTDYDIEDEDSKCYGSESQVLVQVCIKYEVIMWNNI